MTCRTVLSLRGIARAPSLSTDRWWEAPQTASRPNHCRRRCQCRHLGQSRRCCLRWLDVRDDHVLANELSKRLRALAKAGETKASRRRAIGARQRPIEGAPFAWKDSGMRRECPLPTPPGTHPTPDKSTTWTLLRHVPP
ncbi:hypothetical protein H257_00110 [Aphanomyces astaci]|uniref:Uncharacterized protein n=1 Tax=Aphanomyces astaci TaxID=112090 RepID=W4H9D9_APHAT|nr:hypothetical protein H257_00110 [Aphanomyces astaci]ETV88542.1 hypothetical protein H257_00110 [Aphanomyces astaci]|eukprot:XP_009820942.1 hypothetical protein H257_00110 [Aphanomyces astaci]